MSHLSEELTDLLNLGLDHGIESVRTGGGPLVPFVITERDGGRELGRFMATTIEEGLDQAIAWVRAAQFEPGTRTVLVYDGYVSLDGERSDAIFTEAMESGRLVVVAAQRYRPKGRFHGFETIGDPTVFPAAMGKLANREPAMSQPAVRSPSV